MMRLCIMVSLSLGWLSSGVQSSLKSSERAVPQRGTAGIDVRHKYVIMYFGGQINEDLGGGMGLVPAHRALVFVEQGNSRLVEVYQIPQDGSLPPAMVDADKPRRSYTGLARYHHDDPDEVIWVRDWIAANSDKFRDFFVASYPTRGNSEAEIAHLEQIRQSFVSECVISIGYVRDPNKPNGPSLIDLVREYQKVMPRHEPSLPPLATNVYRFVFVGGSLSNDFVGVGGLTSPPEPDVYLEMRKDVIMPDGTRSLTRVELRDVEGSELRMPYVWAEHISIGAIVKLSGTSDATRIIQWIRDNVEQCRDVFLILYATAVMSPSNILELNELRREYPKIKLINLQLVQEGALPLMSKIMELILSDVRVPHAVQPLSS